MKILNWRVDGFHEAECDCGEKLTLSTDVFFEHKARCPQWRD